MSTIAEPVQEIVIEPQRGWRLVDLGELWAYRDLLLNLCWRNMKGRYAQSALGMGWIVLQPLVQLAIFSVVFGRVVKIQTPGGVPYPLFAFCGLVPWTYFSGMMMAGAASVMSEVNILTKVYFPRLILPLSSVAGRVIDLAAMLVPLSLLMVLYGVVPRPSAIVMAPLLLAIATAAAMGMGFWLSAMAVQYRDVAHALGFLSQVWMYLSPVLYPAEMVPDRYRLLYGLNPMVGVISGMRSCLLGTSEMPWDQVAEAAAVSLLLLVTGALYFRRSERLFADVA